MDHPRAGTHYPKSLGEFQAWFRTDADCLDYLEWLRWPSGFVCPDGGESGGWRLGDGRFGCSGCGGRWSTTAGTIFDRTRTPLTVWFPACWLVASGKDGISAMSLQRMLGIGSYQTAWAILHRLRSVMVRPGRELLSGMVEVDETCIGGAEAGLAGGRARGKKVLTGVAVEILEPKGFGRCRMLPLTDASGPSLLTFVKDHIETGSTVITDGWQGYSGLKKPGYVHTRISLPLGVGSTHRPCPRKPAGTRRAWTGRQPSAPGGRSVPARPVKWIAQKRVIRPLRARPVLAQGRLKLLSADAVVHRLVDRVVPHQRRAFGATAASLGADERRRPGQAQLADVRFIDPGQLTVALFGLREAVGEPGARQNVLVGPGCAGKFQRPRCAAAAR